MEPHLQPRSFMRAAVDDISRLGRITNILVRYGFSEIAGRVGLNPKRQSESGADDLDPVDVRKDPRDAARRFRRMLEELGLQPGEQSGDERGRWMGHDRSGFRVSS